MCQPSLDGRVCGSRHKSSAILRPRRTSQWRVKKPQMVSPSPSIHTARIRSLPWSRTWCRPNGEVGPAGAVHARRWRRCDGGLAESRTKSRIKRQLSLACHTMLQPKVYDRSPAARPNQHGPEFDFDHESPDSLSGTT